jgi:hypothetical protein
MNLINYNNEEEVGELQKELETTSNKIKEIAESQQEGIGLTEDFEPRDDDIVSDVSQDSNMSFQTDGDKMTEKDFLEIMDESHFTTEKIEKIYNDLKRRYPDLYEYNRMDKARLQSIFRIHGEFHHLMSLKNMDQDSEAVKKCFQTSLMEISKRLLPK